MGILGAVLRRLIGSEIESVVAMSRIQAAIAYLKLIKGTRRLTVLMCLLVLCVVAMACGLLLIPIALCVFMPWRPETKAAVAVSVAGAYVIISLIAAMTLFSEKRWMRASGADRLVKEALKKPR